MKPIEGHPAGPGNPVSHRDPFPGNPGHSNALHREFVVKWNCCEGEEKEPTFTRTPQGTTGEFRPNGTGLPNNDLYPQL